MARSPWHLSLTDQQSEIHDEQAQQTQQAACFIGYIISAVLSPAQQQSPPQVGPILLMMCVILLVACHGTHIGTLLCHA